MRKCFYSLGKCNICGDPSLKPEHGISNDFGIGYLRNKVLINNEKFQVKNIDKTRQCGFEFEAVYVIPQL
jgi:outer membrane receptor for ferrienterochelin and colicin